MIACLVIVEARRHVQVQLNPLIAVREPVELRGELIR